MMWLHVTAKKIPLLPDIGFSEIHTEQLFILTKLCSKGTGNGSILCQHTEYITLGGVGGGS